MRLQPAKDKIERPRGFIAPKNEIAARAVKAIAEKRFSDALNHVGKLADDSPLLTMWKCYLAGQIYLARGDSDRALHELRTASEVVLPPSAEDPSVLRLRAAALQKLGEVFRRQECVDEAIEAHRQACELREEYGSSDERWESSMSLALDGCISRRYEESLSWLKRALGEAQSTERPHLAQAINNGQLAVVLSELGRDEEALAAAREALIHRRLDDPGDAEAAIAAFRFGQMLLRCARNSDTLDDTSRPCIGEAVSVLQNARDELRAFGDGYEPQIRSCEEQIDFAQRLRQSD